MKKLAMLLLAVVLAVPVLASPIYEWSMVAANNNASPPNGWPEGMNRSDVNNAAREMMAALRAWYDDPAYIRVYRGATVTRVDSDTISIGAASDGTSDWTSYFEVGRRIKLSGGGDTYGFITSSTHTGSETNVDVDVSVPVGTNQADLYAGGVLTRSAYTAPASSLHTYTGGLTAIGGAETAINNLAGLPFPGAPNGSRKYLVSVVVRLQNDDDADITGCKIRMGTAGDVTDALMASVTQTVSSNEGAFCAIPGFIVTPGASDKLTVSTGFFADGSYLGESGGPSYVSIVELPS